MGRNSELIRQWTLLQRIATTTGNTIPKLAADLGVSTRTIRRDLEALQQVGFPIYDEVVNGTKFWRVDARALGALARSGLTYAEYARRGFFELLAVAFLVGGLVLGAESFVRVRTRAYLTALIGLVVLTLVVLASAFLRLRLYQDAYGWTEMRFYVMAAIFWLAIGAAIAIGTILANRSAWLLHGMLGLSIVFGAVFNVIGPVRFVADQNVGRILGSGLTGGKTDFDLAYLIDLGGDAVPAVSRWLSDRPLPPEVVQRITDEMAWASGLDDPRNEAWQAWNLSREHARELLGR